MKIKILVGLVALFLFTACFRSARFVSASFGSDVNLDNGCIINPRLTYVFHYEDRDATLRHYFDYVYFQGDTLCFSFKIASMKKSSRVQVWFLFKGKKVPAERLETSENIVRGFSLVGSLLEQYNADQLDKKFQTLAFPLKINIETELDYSDDKTNFMKISPVSFEVID